ncbi:hypothetical protein [Citrobacter sp. wls613]|uniref:hypothetical protein n=1 Tax=Citrobacter sp. wls613 TaxID=2576436 RepID=UPI0010CA96BA|nr:hypothetical protein [Citrobacter sp. wls613]TKV18660.1 hypothetical protein FDX01_18700 [Citrobacter sp. wls613]
MKSYLITNFEIIGMSLFISLVIIMMMLIFMSYIINKDNYNKIAKLYENKFGDLPYTARMARGASLIGSPGIYLAKVDFIMSSILLPYNKIFNYGMSFDEYFFIRTLPSELTTGFKVEAILWLVEIIVLVCFILLNVFFY